jgi:catechol 2,3-dioxygenase
MAEAMIIGRLAHVHLVVDDVPASVGFYQDLLGLAPVKESPSVTYLATGKGGMFDLALQQGEPALDHFAFAVSGDEDLRSARAALTAAGVESAELEPGQDPGVAAGIRFTLPSGHAMELIVPAAPTVFTPTPMVDGRHFAGVGPVALEHITMTCGDVEDVASFLIEVLGFQLTESVQPPGEPWFNAFLRTRDQHHDAAFFASDDGDLPGLNHVCFAVPSVVDLVKAADLASARGHLLDASIGRHLAGNNVFIYLKDPAGHRVEVNTDMARIADGAPPRVVEAMRFDAWRESIAPGVLPSTPARDRRARAHLAGG